jgi:hypothetical protein
MPSMFSRLAAAGALAMTTALVATMPAPAGQPATNGTDTLQLEAGVRPAVTGSRAKPRPVALDVVLRYGSVSGGPATPIRTGMVRLPAGMKVNLEPKPSCRYSTLALHGLKGCSKRSQVGSGTAILDGRPAGLGYPLHAKVRVFSALVDAFQLPGFRPRSRLIAYAFAPGADVFLPLGGHGLDFAQGAVSAPRGVGMPELRITLRSMRWSKAQGGKPLVQAPTRCAGTWSFAADFTFVRFGPHLVASDEVPCRAQ